MPTCLRIACRILRVLLVVAVCSAPFDRPAAAADLPVYSDTLASGWANWSWDSTLNLSASSPVQSGSRSISVTYTSGWGALYLHTGQPVDLSGYDRLRFWIHGGSTGGQKLRVVANSNSNATFPVTVAANSWTQVDVPLSSLGSPASLSDIWWQDSSGGAQPAFYLDEISLVAASGPPPPPPPSPPPPPPPPPTGSGPALAIDAASGRHPINPGIYGMNFADEALALELRLPVRRRGGNSTGRYNWQNDTSNTGSDWYFENIPEDNPNPATLPNGSAADRFVEQDRRTGTRSILTVPLIGWVARQRKNSHPYDCGFKVSLYGAQDSVDSWDSDCGNGVHGGVPVTGNNPADTSVAATAAFVGDWIGHLAGRYGTAATGGVAYYNLDNEPMLWNSTHRDIHPQPTSYDELRDRAYLYGAAVKAADPSAQTLGPVLWGWTAYFYSAMDAAAGGSWWNNPPDRKAHGDTPFVPWYLQQMQAYQQQHGVRILDYLDLHYYPQAGGVSLSTAGDATTQALRLRSTRSLWDPSYTDESWIGDTVRLIPRMREWVSVNYPGTKLAITEYNWGGLESINGALAQADLLGIFGREVLDLATLWGPPTADQPGAYAFRIYRNYDGAGHGFGETGVQAASADQAALAVYAAQRASDGALTVVIINKGTTNLTSTVSLGGFPLPASAAVYRYSSANPGAIVHLADQPLSGSGFGADFPASSITLLEIQPRTYPLTVTTSGSGGGTVTSVPVGISCQSGSSPGCAAGFPSGSAVTLLATPSSGSIFSGWGGNCSGKAGCSLTLDSARSVAATFSLAPNVRIGATSYATLQDAYDAAASGAVIKLMEGGQDGSLAANRNIAITIKGGFDVAYAGNASQTALHGAISLKQGTVRMERLTIH